MVLPDLFSGSISSASSDVHTMNGISICSFGATSMGTPCIYRFPSPRDSPWSDTKITQLRLWGNPAKNFYYGMNEIIRVDDGVVVGIHQLLRIRFDISTVVHTGLNTSNSGGYFL